MIIDLNFIKVTFHDSSLCPYGCVSLRLRVLFLSQKSVRIYAYNRKKLRIYVFGYGRQVPDKIGNIVLEGSAVIPIFFYTIGK